MKLKSLKWDIKKNLASFSVVFGINIIGVLYSYRSIGTIRNKL